MFVPDLVMTFTCAPDDRPCVASKRFEKLELRNRIPAEARLAVRSSTAIVRDLHAVDIELDRAEAGRHGHAASLRVVRAVARR